MTTQQEQMLAELHSLADQIQKSHYLNAHFRAFQLAYAAWQEHVRQNALAGARGGHVAGQSPAGAVLDDEQSDVFSKRRPHRWSIGNPAECLDCGVPIDSVRTHEAMRCPGREP